MTFLCTLATKWAKIYSKITKLHPMFRDFFRQNHTPCLGIFLRKSHPFQRHTPVHHIRRAPPPPRGLRPLWIRHWMCVAQSWYILVYLCILLHLCILIFYFWPDMHDLWPARLQARLCRWIPSCSWTREEWNMNYLYTSLFIHVYVYE